MSEGIARLIVETKFVKLIYPQESMLYFWRESFYSEFISHAFRITPDHDNVDSEALTLETFRSGVRFFKDGEKKSSKKAIRNLKL